MNYEIGKSDNSDILEIREPAVAYASGPAVGSRAWDETDDDDYDGRDDDPEKIERFFSEREAARPDLYGPGRGLVDDPGTPHEVVFHTLWRKIKKDAEAKIAAGLMPPQSQEYWDFLEREIEETKL